MEAAPCDAVLTFLDGPAAGQEIEVSVPPQSVRWYCQSGEMGSSEVTAWWSMEEPPEDPGVMVVRYAEVEGEPEKREDGKLEYRFQVAPVNQEELSAVEQDLRDRLSNLGAQLAEPAQIPRAYFNDGDVKAILVGDTWFDVPLGTIAKVSEGLIETDAEAKISVGPCFVVTTEPGKHIVIPPTHVQAFEMADSSVGAEAEEHADDGGVIRMSRSVYEGATAADADNYPTFKTAAEGLQAASKVIVIEKDGRGTVVKDRDGEGA